MTLPSIGFHYNHDIRDNGTGMRLWDTYVRHGGKELGGAKYSRPARGDVALHDLHLFIDDGRDDLPMPIYENNACWLVDTHLGWDVRREWANHFDTVFCAQKPAADRMAAEGLNAHWLPLACHPHLDPNRGEMEAVPSAMEATKPLGLEKQHDLAFVGFFQKLQAENQNDRQEFLHQMFERFPNSWLATNVFFEKAAARYIRARLGLNISILNDLNMRFFEAQSYGTCLLSNTDVVGWQELGFVDGEHFVGYSSMEEALDKAAFYLDIGHVAERERIARRGCKFVRSAHTYGHRLHTLVEKCSL
jgi:hypothetical protein